MSATRSSRPIAAALPPLQLAAAGWAVTERGYDMAHSQRIEMMLDARDWLAALS